MSFLEANEKIAEKVVGAHKAIEKTVVGGYKATENAAVSGFNTISDKFIGAFLQRIMKQLRKQRPACLKWTLINLTHLRVMTSKQE